MTGSDGVARPDWEEGGPERLYVVTGGGNRGAEAVPLDLVTLIVSHTGPTPGMNPEQTAILRMCAQPLSVAEISAYLALPTTMIIMLVAGLVAGGHVEVREPAAAGTHSEVALLEAVIDGLSTI